MKAPSVKLALVTLVFVYLLIAAYGRWHRDYKPVKYAPTPFDWETLCSSYRIWKQNQKYAGPDLMNGHCDEVKP